MRALNLCTLPLVSLLLSPGAVHALPGFSGKQPSILAPDDLSAQISDPSALREPPRTNAHAPSRSAPANARDWRHCAPRPSFNSSTPTAKN